MRASRPIYGLIAAALVATLALAGCGGGEPSGNETALLVTRDFGATTIDKELTVPATTGLTAMRQLQAHNDVETTYSGRFVNAIDGLQGGGGEDWLFYVDGIDSDTAATEVRLSGGETVQWDFHPWQSVKLTGAIVGAYPEPMLGRGAEVSCADQSGEACDAVTQSLRTAGVKLDSPSQNVVAVHVGTWNDLRGSKGVPDISKAPAESGVFASIPNASANPRLANADGNLGKPTGSDGGVVFAYRVGNDVGWVVTGATEPGVLAAAKLLETQTLRGRFAVATDGGRAIPLPVQSATGGGK